VVPAGQWFAAEPSSDSAWSLVSCTVAPGFDFADFELAAPDQLAVHDAELTQLCGDWRRFCSQS
jgi:predicted cupin superfamily sugar epimerase